MFEATMIFTVIVMAILMAVAFIRAIIGPTSLDRNTVINVIGTKTVVVMVLISFIYEDYFFVDVALVYALISFIATICVAKYLERGEVS